MGQDKKTASDELEELQLEETRERGREMAATRPHASRARNKRTEALMEARRQQEAIQANCWHKKGGQRRGDVASRQRCELCRRETHTLPRPHHRRLPAMRKLWEPPDRRIERAEGHRRREGPLQKDYGLITSWAVNLPTDNETSGTLCSSSRRPNPQPET